MWKRTRAQSSQSGRVGVELSANGCALAHVDERDGTARVLALESVVDGDSEASGRWLAEQVARHGRAGVGCVATLPPARYSLHRVEAPDVEPEERAAAVGWLVRDLVAFPFEEAVVDHVEIPELRAHAGRPLMHVVAARQSAVREAAATLEAAGLAVDAVDVPELALRNLCEREPDDERGLALLRLGARGGQLVVTQAGSLMLSRAIDLGSPGTHDAHAIALPGEESDPIEDWLDAAVLEVQRTLDYFESQIGSGSVAALLLAPAEDAVPALEPHLEKQLAVPVRRLELASRLDFTCAAEPQDLSRCIVALGAALRREDER